ncbi:MAG: DbpA RNA binding domain-containing protein, partial [Deltaproteobacteria bacterium]|nr:DbpA RNA binding domain-containing protein [Deltaproteobacteria bacterium]
PSADPSIYYQRSGLATGTTPKFGVVSLVSTQDLVNFQYLRKASNLQFEVYSTIKGDVTENRKRILESVLTKFVSQFETSQQLDERMNDYVSKLRSDRELLERSVPLLLDVFLRHIPSETDRSADSKENLPRKSVKVSVKEARIFVNLGSNHEFSESALKALLDQAIEGGAQHLIRVSIRKNYSFFDVVDFVSDELLEKLNGISWNGNKVGVRLAVRLNPLKSEVGKEG